jgi:hypothetical protein
MFKEAYQKDMDTQVKEFLAPLIKGYIEKNWKDDRARFVEAVDLLGAEGMLEVAEYLDISTYEKRGRYYGRNGHDYVNVGTYLGEKGFWCEGDPRETFIPLEIVEHPGSEFPLQTIKQLKEIGGW